MQSSSPGRKTLATTQVHRREEDESPMRQLTLCTPAEAACQLLPLCASLNPRIPRLPPPGGPDLASKNLDLTLHAHAGQGEFILVVDAPLAACPRRPADGSFALVNSGPNPRVYKLNVSEEGKDLVAPPSAAAAGKEQQQQGPGAAGRTGNGVLVNRDGGFEFQRESS